MCIYIYIYIALAGPRREALLEAVEAVEGRGLRRWRLEQTANLKTLNYKAKVKYIKLP